MNLDFEKSMIAGSIVMPCLDAGIPTGCIHRKNLRGKCYARHFDARASITPPSPVLLVFLFETADPAIDPPSIGAHHPGMTEFDDPKSLTDAELIALYQEYGFEAGDPVGDAVAAEIERRNLDV